MSGNLLKTQRIYQIYMIWFGWSLWHITQCRLFNAKSYVYMYIKSIGFRLVGFYDISTIVGYLMSNPLYTYIKYKWFGLAGFYSLSTIVYMFMPNPLCRYISNTYELICLSLWHINYYMLFNAKIISNIYIKYISFGLFGFYGISTIICYFTPKSFQTYILNI